MSYPDKQVAMCLRGNTLLKDLPGAHPICKSIFDKQGIDVHFGTGYSKEQEDQILTKAGSPYDLVIDCRGFKYLGPEKYLQDGLAACID